MPWTTMTLFVRGRQPESVVKRVTAAMHELDPTLVGSNVRTIESALAESLARERISALISTSFGIGGLLLTPRHVGLESGAQSRAIGEI
jgi:hypothetical protein